MGNPGQQPTPLVQLPALPVEIQATCGVCTPQGRSLVVLLYWFPALPAQQWVCLPLGSAGACAANGLGRRFALPLSALLRQHGRTSHVVLPGSEGCPWPTYLAFPKTDPHPSPYLAHVPVSALQLISIWLPVTFPTSCSTLLPSTYDNYRGIKKQLNSYSDNRG